MRSFDGADEKHVVDFQIRRGDFQKGASPRCADDVANRLGVAGVQRHLRAGGRRRAEHEECQSQNASHGRT